MTLTWVEDRNSRAATIVRTGTRGTATYVRSFKVFGTDNDDVLHNEINSTVSSDYAYWQYPGTDVRLAAQTYNVSYLGDKCWQLTVNYEKQGADNEAQPDPVRRSRSFDTTGGTTHITQGIKDESFPNGERRYGVGGASPPDQQGAIGVDDDRVSGVDIVLPNLQWTETYDVPASYVTNDYVRNVANITGTTNRATFRSLAAGEVLFIGCSGQQEWDEDRGDGPWSLSFRFVANPNAGAGQTLPAISIGDIEGIEKRGHEYMWVRYESAVESESLIKKPKFVYVNRVYKEGDFSLLGIGVN